MMSPKAVIAASAVLLSFGASGAQAVPHAVIDQITRHLKEQGFTRFEIDIERSYIDIDAYGPGIEGDFDYTHDGHLIRSDIDRRGHGYRDHHVLDAAWRWSGHDDDHDHDDLYDHDD